MAPDRSAIEIVRQLKADEIHKRLDENESERKALLVLLRAAQAKERGRTKKTTIQFSEGGK